MLLSELESAIADRLKPLETSNNFKVITFPDSPEELARPAFNRLIVRFVSESLTTPQTFNPQARVQQQRIIQFGVLIQHKDLRARKELQATDLMDAIRDRLTLFQPDPKIHQWLYQTSGAFVEILNGFWAYQMTFDLPYPYTKKPER